MAASSRIDALLMVMVLIWGANFTVVKVGLRELTPGAFNAARLVLASLVFAASLGLARTGVWAGSPGWQRLHGADRPILGRDWLQLAWLGLVGHFAYQLCFIGGLARTSAANSSLILACTPVFVALLSVALGHERLGRFHWLGLAFSLAGMYLVAGRHASLAQASAIGDLVTVAATLCWAVYTVGARDVLTRHSPLVVTGYSLMMGSVAYVTLHAPALAATDWTSLHAGTWLAVAGSAILAINVAYLIWYLAVQRIGNARTSVWSNVTPIVAMTLGAIFLGERVDLPKIAGTAAILAGVSLSRLGSRVQTPPEGA